MDEENCHCGGENCVLHTRGLVRMGVEGIGKHEEERVARGTFPVLLMMMTTLFSDCAFLWTGNNTSS